MKLGYVCDNFKSIIILLLLFLSFFPLKMKRKLSKDITDGKDSSEEKGEVVLTRDFYARDTLLVSKELLGKILVCVNKEDGTVMKARIVETEAYVEKGDKACHGYKGKTARNAVMFGEPGHAYIYLIYGMYNCINFVTERSDYAAAVLIRSLEPLEGVDRMCENRAPPAKKKASISAPKKKQLKMKDIASGPGKLCMAFGLTKDSHNGADLCTKDSGLYVVNAPCVEECNIVQTTRIGVDYPGKDALHPWRFYIKGNECVSKRIKNE